MSDTIKGLITRIGAVEERPYQDKVYKSRKFRVKTQEQYPQVFEMEVAEAKMSMLDSYKVNDQVIAHINLRGREWSKDGKDGVFMSMQCWKLERDGAGGTTYSNGATPEMFNDAKDVPNGEKDDLPF